MRRLLVLGVAGALLVTACSADSSGTAPTETPATPAFAPGPNDTGIYTTVNAAEHADEGRTHVFDDATFGGSLADDAVNEVVVRTAPGDYPGTYNVVTRNPDEIFVYYGVYGEQGGVRGPAVARLDADTLEEVWNTQVAVYDDNSTAWNYPGVVGLHGNGTLIVVSGNTAAVLDPETGEIINQADLPQDDPATGSYNGFATTSDGTLFTKALFRSCDTEGSPALFRCLDTEVTQTMLAIDPVSLEIIDQVELPDFSTGRIPTAVHDGVDYVYLPGESSLYRYRWEEQSLALDEDWGFVTVAEEDDLTALMPNITEDWAFVQVNTGSPKPMPVWAISTSDSSVRHSIRPFEGTEAFASFNAAHGSFDPDSGLLYAADTGAGLASALAFDAETGFEIRWVEEQTMSVFQQLIDAPDQRVLVTNELINFPLNPLAATNEQVVFRDASTGRELARTEELPRMSEGANISPGFGGRVYFPGVDGKLYEITVHSDHDARPATSATTEAPSMPVGPGGRDADETTPPFFDGRLVAADYWDPELRILSAGMGFDGIIGWPDEEFETIRAGGGSYFEPSCAADPIVSGAAATTVEALYRGVADDTPDYDDGLPVVFTWPVLTSTMHPEDFLFTLNNGDQVVPNSVSPMPNYELNERNVAVVFGDFGNRGRVGEPDALYPVTLEIVDDGTPLTFLGPDGPHSGVGLTWEGGTSPYTTGPQLVGAKLNHVGDQPDGEGGAPVLDRVLLPNDEFALYGGGDFRLRMLTSGGFTPTGITGLTPDAYEDHFVIHATAEDGSTILMTEVGVDYEVAGGTLRVLGLADLGRPEDQGAIYDLCYVEDVDNYIDIILIGDEAAARSITHVGVPSEGDYLPLYNPGGPGPTPFPDVRYTAPSPPDLEPVIIALDDAMRVSTP